MKYHVASFHKCASHWTRALFRDIADQHGMDVWIDRPTRAPINKPVERGSDNVMCIYRGGARSTFLDQAQADDRVVLCVRDPKDVLVSQYFSWRNTHNNNGNRIIDARGRLRELSLRDGLRLLVDERLISFCSRVRKWPSPKQDKSVHLLCYEDLLASFEPSLRAAAEHMGIELTPAYIGELQDRYSFKKVSKRNPGEEDQSSHYRKGVSGDWMNYFDEELAAAFDSAYGDVCDRLGYDRAGGVMDRRHADAQ